MNESVYRQACAYLDEHREALAEDLMRLVRIPSVSVPGDRNAPFGENCLRVLQETLSMGQERGFVAEIYDNQVGKLALKPGEVDVGFWGHLDVVPEGGNWEHSPFDPVIEQGYVIGRGASDNKGAVVGLLYVLSCLQALGLPLKKNYALYLGTDEERGMADVEHFVKYFDPPKMSIVTDCGFPVCYAEKGIIDARLVSVAPFTSNVVELSGGLASNVVPDSAGMTILKTEKALSGLAALPAEVEARVEERVIRLTAKGVCGHTAFPQNAVNAIRVLTDAVLKAELLPEQDLNILHFLNKVNDDVYGTTLHILSEDEISGRLTCVGSTLCLRDRHADLGINIRYPVKERDERLTDSIATACAQHGFVMDLERVSAPNHFPLNHPAVQKLTELYNQETGQDSKPYAMAGGTHARKLPNAFAYGPGFPGGELPKELFSPGHGGAHGPDEALDLDRLLRALKIYIKAILLLDEMEL